MCGVYCLCELHRAAVMTVCDGWCCSLQLSLSLNPSVDSETRSVRSSLLPANLNTLMFVSVANYYLAASTIRKNHFKH
jgi:hypothetical protein